MDQNLNFPVYNCYQGIKIPAGSAITITNKNEINADYVTKGQTVDFVVDNPVSINGVNVIKAGTSVTAEVLNKSNNFIFGIPGEISIGNFKLNNVGTNPINMSGSISDKGSSRYWLADCLAASFSKGRRWHHSSRNKTDNLYS